MKIDSQNPIGHTLTYRPDIDGLRAIAVGSVVGFHAFPAWVCGGFVGVDIFFVISGYLITSIIYQQNQSNSFSLLNFYNRRIRRIFPALLAVIIFCLVLGYFILLPDQLEELGLQTLAGSIFLENFLMWSKSGYFDVSAAQRPLLHLWSLAIEEQFYIIFPIFMITIPRKWVVQSLLALFIGSIIFSLYQVEIDNIADFYSPLSRSWEFILGSLLSLSRNAISRELACLSQETKRLGTVIGTILPVLGLSLILGSVFLLNRGDKFPGAWAFFPTAGGALMILSGGNNLLNRKIMSHPIIVGIGKISYPLYLWHWPVLFFSGVLTAAPADRTIRISAVIASFILSITTYFWIEKPLRFGRYFPTKIFALSMGMICMAIVGAFYWRTDGLPNRFPPVVNDIISFSQASSQKQAWRESNCFLVLPQQSYKDFDSCKSFENETSLPADAPHLLLWGDSHAAHLYPGLAAHYGMRWRILQRTATSCSPFLKDSGNPIHCDSIATGVRQEMQAHPAQRAILALRWSAHDLTELPDTITFLQQIGIKDILVIGPLPSWQEKLPHQIIDFILKHSIKSINGLPIRFKKGLDRDLENRNVSIESELKNVCDKMHVHYISMINLLCSGDGCLIRVGNDVDDIITPDYDHFSVRGSEFIADYLH